MKLADLHIRHHDDATYTAIWGPFLLKSGFQPIFRMGGGPARIGAFEALCRPLRNGVATSPGKFFPLVPKDEGFLVELQTRAVHVLNAPSVLTGNEWLFLNFDPSMFKSRGAVNDALSILNETLAIAGFDRKRIVCEVTEHRTEEENLLSLVGAMRDRGYKIAVDDYGADDSDMARVRKLSPDIIKFDAYWITRMMDSGTAGAALLKDMVLTFKERGILTLFEGIEDGWQLDLAVECEVDFVQGYVLARPQTVPTNFSDFRSKTPAAANPLPQVVAERPQMRTSLDLWDKEFSALMDQSMPVAAAVNASVSSEALKPVEPMSLSAVPASLPSRRPAVAFGKRTR